MSTDCDCLEIMIPRLTSIILAIIFYLTEIEFDLTCRMSESKEKRRLMRTVIVTLLKKPYFIFTVLSNSWLESKPLTTLIWLIFVWSFRTFPCAFRFLTKLTFWMLTRKMSMYNQLFHFNDACDIVIECVENTVHKKRAHWYVIKAKKKKLATGKEMMVQFLC